MSSFYESQKFAVLRKVDKPICKLSLKLTRQLRKLKPDWSTVNSVIQCCLILRKKRILRTTHSSKAQPISGCDIFLVASRAHCDFLNAQLIFIGGKWKR